MKRWTYEKKLRVLMNTALMSFIVIEMAFAIVYSQPMSDYIDGLITEEVKLAREDAIMGSLPYIGAIYLVTLIMLLMWIKFSHVEYEKEQLGMDSMEGPVEVDDFTRFMYLIQSKPDSVKQVNTEQTFLEIIQNSESFQSLYNSIVTDVKNFSFEDSNIFKQARQKFEDEKAEIIRKQEDEKKEGVVNIAAKKSTKKTTKKTSKKMSAKKTTEKKSKIKTVGKKILQGAKNLLLEEFDVIPDKLMQLDKRIKEVNDLKNLHDVFKEVKTHKNMFLYYRNVEKVVRIDDPNVDPFDENSKDRLYGIKGMYYIIPDDEKDYYDKKEREDPFEGIKLRKAYIDWKLVGFVGDNVALFIDRGLMETGVAITGRTIDQAKIMALSYLMDLTLQSDKDLRDKIARQDKELTKTKKTLSEKEDKLIEQLIDSNELESHLRKRIEFRPINFTVIIFGVILFLLGYFWKW